MDSLLQLAERVEAASADEQGALIREAVVLLNPLNLPDGTSVTPQMMTAHNDWRPLYERVVRMIAVEAYESAALLLVPEGWRLHFLQDTADDNPEPKRWSVELWWHGDERALPSPWTFACSPALALVSAALKARALSARMMEKNHEAS